jgi:hypothetical protein
MGQKVSRWLYFFTKKAISCHTSPQDQNSHHTEEACKNEGTHKGDCNTSAPAVGKKQKEEVYATIV